MQSTARPGAPDLTGLDDDGLLDIAEDVVGRLGATTLGGAIDDGELLASVQRLIRIERGVRAEVLRRVAEVDAREAYRVAGVRSTRDWLTERLALTAGEARTIVETACALEELPEVADKLRKGDVGTGQAEEAGRALDRAVNDTAGDPDAFERRRSEIEDVVTKRGGEQDRRQLRRSLDEAAHRAGSDALADRDRRAFRERRLNLYKDAAGMPRMDASLAVETFAKVSAMVDALARPTGADDERTPAQRRHDALDAIAERYLDEGRLPQVAVQRPHALLLTNPGAQHDVPGSDPAQLDGLGPVSNDTARQFCCDADTGVVTRNRNGEILDAGRRQRDPSRRQRDAVIARDQVCTGCGADASRCQIHHIRYWRDNGATDLTNLVLVCTACHTNIHHFGWVVARGADGSYRAGPPGRHADAAADDAAQLRLAS